MARRGEQRSKARRSEVGENALESAGKWKTSYTVVEGRCGHRARLRAERELLGEAHPLLEIEYLLIVAQQLLIHRRHGQGGPSKIELDPASSGDGTMWRK